MYKKQEAAKLRQEFWTAFGKYMAPILSAEGENINWLNYKTGQKYVYFRKEAGQRDAFMAVELQHPDPGMRRIHMVTMRQFESLFQATAGMDWDWEDDVPDADGRIISRIVSRIGNVSVFNREHWPELIRFFKQNSIGLDAFWAEVKYAFEAL